MSNIALILIYWFIFTASNSAFTWRGVGKLQTRKQFQLNIAARFDESHTVHEWVERELPTDTHLLEVLLEGLEHAVTTKNFDTAFSLICAIVRSKNADVVTPILSALDDTSWDYDYDDFGGETLSFLGPAAIPKIVEELHSRKHSSDWTALIALAIFHKKGEGGGDEILRYLGTLSEEDRATAFRKANLAVIAPDLFS